MKIRMYGTSGGTRSYNHKMGICGPSKMKTPKGPRPRSRVRIPRASTVVSFPKGRFRVAKSRKPKMYRVRRRSSAGASKLLAKVLPFIILAGLIGQIPKLFGG